jgi:transcriptional regulator with XRE-family HTH domain
VDSIRFGRSVRLLRQNRDWRQDDLALRAGCSRAAISRIEQGHLAGLSVGALDRVATALGASLDLRLFVPGGALDRLHDRGHAALVEAIAARLVAAGWEVIPEASFSIYGERGSIDLLALHPASGHLLVVEVKTTIIDIQDLLATIDRKGRLARDIARDRGWRPTTVSRLVVVAASQTNRRRVDQHRTLFDRSFPLRGAEVSARLRRPAATSFSGLLFVSNVRHAAVRHRVARRSAMRRRGTSPESVGSSRMTGRRS